LTVVTPDVAFFAALFFLVRTYFVPIFLKNLLTDQKTWENKPAASPD